MLVKENHINHIAIDTCKLFIIFVQLFFTVEIVGKRRKMLDNVCAIFQHFCTYKPLNISTVKGNKCWILIISILWTILYRNEMEGNDGKLDTNWHCLKFFDQTHSGFFFLSNFPHLHSIINLSFIISFSVQVIISLILVLTYHYLYILIIYNILYIDLYFITTFLNKLVYIQIIYQFFK